MDKHCDCAAHGQWLVWALIGLVLIVGLLSGISRGV